MAHIQGDTITVDLVLDPAVLPTHRELRFRWPEGVRAERLGWPTDQADGSLGQVRAPLQVRYRVALPSAGVSFRRPGGWHIEGRAFLPELLADGRAVDAPATLRLDAGDEPIWTAVGQERPLIDSPSLRRLAEEAYEVGPLQLARREVGAAVVWVATSGEEPLDITSDTLAQMLQSLSRRLGPLPLDDLLLVFHRIDDDSRTARVGASIVHAGPDGLPPDPLLSSEVILDLTRLWLPGRHRVTEGWLGEGVPDYLAVLTTSELLTAPSVSVARVILDTERGTWASSREVGRAAGFCLDARLQEAGSSLGAVLRTALTRDPGELGIEELLEDLAAIAPASAGYLAALLGGGAAIPLDDCLERVGLETRQVPFEGRSDRAVLDALGIEAAAPTPHAHALRIEAVPEGSSFRAGDVLTELAGAWVGSAGDAAWALRERGPGDRVTATVRRGGQAQALEVLLPDLDGPREPRVWVELAPIE